MPYRIRISSQFDTPVDGRPRGWRATGIVTAIVGIGVVAMAAIEPSIPPRDGLASASGIVTSVQKSKSIIRFNLDTEGRTFQHLSKAGRFRDVHASLLEAQANRAPVTVAIMRSTRPDAHNERHSLLIYALRVGDRDVLTHEQAHAAWESNRGIGIVLGSAFLLAGVGFVAAGRR